MGLKGRGPEVNGAAKLPIGSRVAVRLETGREFFTRTLSLPCELANGDFVVLVEGLRGVVDLRRVEPVVTHSIQGPMMIESERQPGIEAAHIVFDEFDPSEIAARRAS